MKKWNILSPETPKNKKELTTLLLKNRGIEHETQIKEFLHPTVENVTIKRVKIDEGQVVLAVKRIKKAIKKNEQIVIFGDYDVDGITGTAILWETIYWSLQYKNVHPYIPHRVNEGYGISEKGIDLLLSEVPNTGLIITVDNGIVAHEPVAYAKSKDIDVIITDHHLPKETLPEAYSIIHTTKLCGASVALLLSLELEEKKLTPKDPHLELAALATVADMVPLTDSNRVILKFGIEALRISKRSGIKALTETSGIDQEKIGVYEIGHMIAPRLNAAGRLEHALDSLRLLCTRDAQRAKELASAISVVNKERQTITEELIIYAKKDVVFEKSTKIVISSSPEYNQGVIGLVASRLTENFYRPSLVISKGEEISKGSARSIKGVNIIELIRSASTFLTEAGGHPMAAGFSLRTEHLPLFIQEITEKAQDFINESYFERSVMVDCGLPGELITDDTYTALQALSPFGTGNYDPVFLTKSVEVVECKKIGKDMSHLKMKFLIGNKKIGAIGFGLGRQDQIPREGEFINIIFSFSMNEWNGTKALQLVIKDYLLGTDSY